MQQYLFHPVWSSCECVCFHKQRHAQIQSHSFDVFLKDNDESHDRLFTGATHAHQAYSSITQQKRNKEDQGLWEEKGWNPHNLGTQEQTEYTMAEACLLFPFKLRAKAVFFKNRDRLAADSSGMCSPERVSDNSCCWSIHYLLQHMLAHLCHSALSNDLWWQWCWIRNWIHIVDLPHPLPLAQTYMSTCVCCMQTFPNVIVI